jgi:hypothetical protein
MSEEDPISKYVVPVVELTKSGTTAGVARLLGTAFYIGNGGHLLTAAHFLTRDEQIAIWSAEGAKWVGYPVVDVEIHPHHDVALLRTRRDDIASYFAPSFSSGYAAAPYFQFSYPEDVAHELVEGGRIKVRPDLVYSEGHIRRRMTDIPVPRVRETHLYELSALGGPGASGSPVISKPMMGGRSSMRWLVIGVYVGERVSTAEGQLALAGYAVRMDALSEWRPRLLGGRTLDEVESSR